MYSPYLTRIVGCFYWRVVKRWPVVYLLCCFLGLAVGVGCLFLFGTAEPNERKAVFLRVLGILMLVVYSWWLVSFIIRCARRSWEIHCETRIAQLDAL